MAAKQNLFQKGLPQDLNSRVEYSVYTVLRPDGGDHQAFNWEKKHTTSDKNMAIARAKILSRSDDYSRVEIQKMICNDDSSHCVSEGFKIYDAKDSQPFHWKRAVVLSAFCLVALGALLVVL